MSVSATNPDERTPLLQSAMKAQPGRNQQHVGHRDSDIEEEDDVEAEVKREADEEDEDEEEDDDEEEEDPPQPPITTRQYLILSVLMIATLTSSFAVCLFPPFFPKIAEEKGCNAAVYGFIIGTNCLTSFIVTPFIGKKVSWKERRLIDV